MLAFLILLGSPILFLSEGYLHGTSFDYLDTALYFFQEGEYVIPQDHPVSWISSIRSPLFAILINIIFHVLGPSVSSALVLTKGAAFLTLFVVFALGKELYDFRVGLVAVSLAGTSWYLIDYPAHIDLDQIQSLFMLLSLYVFVLSCNRGRIYSSMLAGSLLGVGFLIKESSVLWVTVPLLIFLLVGSEHYRFYFKSILVFWLGFGLPIAGWWGYFFIHTGNLFLFDTYYFSWASSFFDRMSMVSLGFPLLAMATALLIVLFLGLRFVNLTKNNIRHLAGIVSRRKAQLKIIGQLSGWFVFVSLLVLFSTMISRMGVWFYSLLELVPRLEGFLELWYRIRVVPKQPLLYYAPFALVIVTYLAIWRKNKPDVFILVAIIAYLPLFLAMGFRGQSVWMGRYLMTVFWVSYLVLGRVLVLLVDTLSWLVSRIKFVRKNLKFKLMLNAILLLSIAFYLMLMVPPLMYSDPMQTFNPNEVYNNQGVKAAATWINENLDAGTRIGSNFHYLQALYFYTTGQYNWIPQYKLGSNPDPEVPIDKMASLFMWDDSWHLARRVIGDKTPLNTVMDDDFHLEEGLDPLTSDSPLYIRFRNIQQYPRLVATREEYIPLPQYWIMDQNRLAAFIKNYSVDYVVWAVGSHPLMFDTMPPYFSDMMDQVFHTTWKITTRENRQYQYEIFIFRVNHNIDLSQTYPVSVEKEALSYLTKQANELTNNGGASTFGLIQALGLKPILISPTSPDNMDDYLYIAETFSRYGEIDLAAVQYHIALSETPAIASEVLDIATRLSYMCPDCVGPYMLLGDAYRIQDQLEQAQSAYVDALAALEGSDTSRAIVHRGRGLLYLSAGQYHQAIREFEQSMDLSMFGAAKTRHLILIAQANLYQVGGEIDKAIRVYQQMLYSDPVHQVPAMPVSFYSQSYDFVRQLDHAEVHTMEELSVQSVVFIIDDQPRLVLFAHPPSQVSYSILVPANAMLRFAPVIAPEVWHLGKGDGVQFKVDLLETRSQIRYLLYSKYIDPKNVTTDRVWLEQEIDLSPWAGQTVTVTFATDPGPNDDNRYDWAGWGEPRIVQPIAFDFLEHFPEATTTLAGEFGQVYTETQTINYEPRPILFQHPTSRVVYPLNMPLQSTLRFGIGLDPAIWSQENGDGVEYNVYVRYPDDPKVLHRVFQRYIDPKNNPDERRWFDERVDLSRFGGQAVEIIFEALPGPSGDANYDWGGWSTPVLIDETLQSQNKAIPIYSKPAEP